MPLTKTTDNVLNGSSVLTTVAVASDGTNKLPAHGILLDDGTTFFDGNVGASGTKVTAAAMPTGGVGFLGWLSAIANYLAGTLTVSGTVTAAGAAGGSFSATFTRPADTTAYTAGDVVSNSTSSTTMMTFSNVVSANGKGGYITGARLHTDKKSITPRIRVHLYSDNTATVSADNAAHQYRFADISKRLGYFDLPAMTTPADTTNSTESVGQDFTQRVRFQCGASSRTVYAVLEALDAFTPASGENFTLVLNIDGES